MSQCFLSMQLCFFFTLSIILEVQYKHFDNYKSLTTANAVFEDTSFKCKYVKPSSSITTIQSHYMTTFSIWEQGMIHGKHAYMVQYLQNHCKI